jgi:hypothetical protein
MGFRSMFGSPSPPSPPQSQPFTPEGGGGGVRGAGKGEGPPKIYRKPIEIKSNLIRELYGLSCGGVDPIRRGCPSWRGDKENERLRGKTGGGGRFGSRLRDPGKAPERITVPSESELSDHAHPQPASATRLGASRRWDTSPYTNKKHTTTKKWDTSLAGHPAVANGASFGGVRGGLLFGRSKESGHEGHWARFRAQDATGRAEAQTVTHSGRCTYGIGRYLGTKPRRVVLLAPNRDHSASLECFHCTGQ